MGSQSLKFAAFPLYTINRIARKMQIMEENVTMSIGLQIMLHAST